MSNLWWLQPGWTDARCACCGNKIWPEGDPDWGLCWPCKSEESRQQEEENRNWAEMEADRLALSTEKDDEP